MKEVHKTTNESIVYGIVSLLMAVVVLVFLPWGDAWWYCGIPAAILTVVFFFRSTRMKKAGEYHQFNCLLCGYRWEWREGEPWPEVQVRPELIARGTQKLEEEEEERKRQEALYHLSKLGKK
jgi:hypothetical protein